MKIFKLIFSCFILLFSTLASEDWFSEYWHQFFWKAYESYHFGVRTFFRIEAGNHFKNTRVLFLNEQLV